MSFKPKQKTALLCKIMVVKCLLYLADVAVEFRVEVLRCQPNVRLTSYLGLQDSLVIGFYLVLKQVFSFRIIWIFLSNWVFPLELYKFRLKSVYLAHPFSTFLKKSLTVEA